MKAEWKAQYNDGTSLQQHNADGSENLFKEIQQDKLKEFFIDFDGKNLSLNLLTGIFYINGFQYNTDLSDSKEEKRLIYFVRRKHTMGTNLQVIPGLSSDTYYLGFQTTIDGKNHKRMVAVKNGMLSFEQ